MSTSELCWFSLLRPVFNEGTPPLRTTTQGRRRTSQEYCFPFHGFPIGHRRCAELCKKQRPSAATTTKRSRRKARGSYQSHAGPDSSPRDYGKLHVGKSSGDILHPPRNSGWQKCDNLMNSTCNSIQFINLTYFHAINKLQGIEKNQRSYQTSKNSTKFKQFNKPQRIQ